MSKYLVQIKRGPVVLAQFECLAFDSVTAVNQHMELADWFGGYLSVKPMRGHA